MAKTKPEGGMQFGTLGIALGILVVVVSVVWVTILSLGHNRHADEITWVG